MHWIKLICDSADAIEALLAECARKDETRKHADDQVQTHENRYEVLEAELARVKLERDAAIADMQWLQDDTGEGCDYCAHYGDCKEDECPGWAWRGPREEDNHEAD